MCRGHSLYVFINILAMSCVTRCMGVSPPPVGVGCMVWGGVHGLSECVNKQRARTTSTRNTHEQRDEQLARASNEHEVTTSTSNEHAQHATHTKQQLARATSTGNTHVQHAHTSNEHEQQLARATSTSNTHVQHTRATSTSNTHAQHTRRAFRSKTQKASCPATRATSHAFA